MLDPSIILNTQQQPGIMDAISSGFQSAEAIRNAPLMRQLMAQRFQQGQGAIQAQQFNQQQAQAQAGRENATQEGLYINRLAKTLREAPQSMRAGIIAQSSEAIRAFGADPSKVPLDDQSLDNAIAATNQFNLPDPSLGLESRRLDIREQELDQRRYLAENEADRKGDIKRSQLEAEIELKPTLREQELLVDKRLQPEIKSAVQSAVNKANEEAKLAQNARSDSSAMRVYDVGMSGLISALGGTSTGPLVGRLPAVTADAQIAEGAISAMAPILKSMFRSAGEGTFTDKDQELLLRMVPTRSDKQDAIKAKLENIDAIVRAKLNQPEQATVNEPSVQQPKRLRFNPQTGRLE